MWARLSGAGLTLMQGPSVFRSWTYTHVSPVFWELDLRSCRPFGGAWGGCGGIPACSSAPWGWTALGFHCCSFHPPARCRSSDTCKCLWSKVEHCRIEKSYPGYSQVRGVCLGSCFNWSLKDQTCARRKCTPSASKEAPENMWQSSKEQCLRAQALESDNGGPKLWLKHLLRIT
jgi:hypothetical protein